MDILIFRYGLPGLPVSLVIYTLFASSEIDFVSDILDIPIVISLALILGYYIHQVWFLSFEKSTRSYADKDRKVLTEIKDKIGNDDKYKMFFYDGDPYHIWDTMLYSDLVPKGIRDKDRGMWHSYHTNHSNALGLRIGAFVSLAYLIFELTIIKSPNFGSLETISVIYVIIFFLLSYLLSKKAEITRRLVEGLEVYWVKLYFKQYISELVEQDDMYTENEME